MIRRYILVLGGLLLLGTAAGAALFQDADAGADMTSAATAFVESLNDQQREQAVLSYDTPQRVEWHFIPKDYRKGLQVKDMTEAQRDAAEELLRSCLSEAGAKKAKMVIALEGVLRELEKDRDGGPLRDPERYYVTLFGKPSDKAKWGLSIEGHHLSLNFVVENNQLVSSTPTFFAANPATLEQTVGDVAKGTRVLEQEEQKAFDLVQSLSDEQRATAVIAEQAPREIRAAGEPQPPSDDPVGIAYADLNDEQKLMMRELVGSYVSNVPESEQQRRIRAIRDAGPENVHFAWAGAMKPGVGHYYRIQGPSFLIEFVNTQPDSAGNPANHIHCVWRDMDGDFALPRN